MNISNISKQWRQTVVTLIVNLLSVHLGVIFSWLITNRLESMIERENHYLLKRTKTVSFLCILAVLPLAAFITERFGRKKALAWSAVPFLLCSILIATAKNSLFILVAATCGAIACALQFYVVPMYVCEISSDDRRGAHGIIRPMLTAIGLYLGCMMSDVWLKPINVTLGLLLPALFLMLLVKLPESPVWLARKNKTSKANRVLAWLGIAESSSVSENVKLNEELGTIEPTNPEPIAFMKMFKCPEVRKGCVVSVGLLLGQGIIQIDVTNHFRIATLYLAGRLSFQFPIFEDWKWLLAINIAILTALCIAASLLIDRIGRVPLLTVSCICMTIAYVIKGTARGAGCNEWSFEEITAAIIYITFYYVGMGSLPSVIAVEIIPNSVGSYIYAISMGVYWIAVWIVAEILIPFLWDSDFYEPYILYGQAIICALLFVFVVAFVPETKKRPISSPVSVSSH